MEQMLQLARHERTDPHLVAQGRGSRNSSQKLLEAKVQAHVGFGGGQELSRIHHQRGYRPGPTGEPTVRTGVRRGSEGGRARGGWGGGARERTPRWNPHPRRERLPPAHPQPNGEPPNGRAIAEAPPLVRPAAHFGRAPGDPNSAGSETLFHPKPRGGQPAAFESSDRS